MGPQRHDYDDSEETVRRNAMEIQVWLKIYLLGMRLTFWQAVKNQIPEYCGALPETVL